jgi:hypothetical protein
MSVGAAGASACTTASSTEVAQDQATAIPIIDALNLQDETTGDFVRYAMFGYVTLKLIADANRDGIVANEAIDLTFRIDDDFASAGCCAKVVDVRPSDSPIVAAGDPDKIAEFVLAFFEKLGIAPFGGCVKC